jgi:hypothetical protein
MKKIFLLFLLAACNSAEPEKNISTADPNVLAPDSNAVIDNDNPYDSSYSVALDSAGKTITQGGDSLK